MLSLTKIELYGFKSFADRTVININHDITAIVGPNGCGKSNVLDAIKWVLGEQSASKLRGDSMKSVIFNGTDARKSLSYCECSLHFDNSNGAFPIELPEVVFTRKLDKSGNSEYFINQKLCLKRDVINLLYDTGVGKDGYSIIGQNKIYEILSAKNEDRRRIFEEAAGISKFKVQKKTTEDNIKEANISIDRLNGEIHVLENRLRPLKEQVEKKRKYDETYAQLRYYDINNYLFKSGKTEEEKIKLIETIVALRTELDIQEAQNEAAGKDIEAAKFLFSQADAEFTRLNKELTELKIANTDTRGTAKETASRMNSAQENSERLEKLLKDVADRKLLLEKQKQDTQDEYGRLCVEQEKKNEELRIVDQKKSELNAKLSVEQNLVRDVSQLTMDFERLAEIRANLSKFRTIHDMNSQSLDKLRESYPQKKARYDAENTEAARQETRVQELTRKKNEVTRRIGEITKYKLENEDAKKEHSQMLIRDNTALGAATGRLSNLEADKNNYSAYVESVTMLMRESKKNAELSYRVRGTVAELVRVAPKYEAAIDTALGNTVQNIVTPTDEDAKHLIYYMRQRDFGHATFLPLNSIRPRELDSRFDTALNEDGVIGLACDLVSVDSEFEPLLKHLLGNIVVVETIEKAIIMARRYRYQFRIVTLDGDSTNVGGSISGGSRKKGGSRVMNQEKEIAACKIEINKLNVRIANYNKAIAECDDYIDSCNENMSNCLAESSSLAEQIETARSRRDAALKNAQELEQTVAEIEKDIEKLSIEVSTLSQQIQLIDKEEASASEQRKRTEEQSGASQAAERKLTEERDECSKQSTELLVALADVRRNILNAQETLTRLDRERAELESDEAAYRSEKQGVEQRILSYQEELKNYKLTDEDTKKLEDLEAGIAKLAEDKRVYFEQASDLEAKRTVRFSKISELKVQLERSERNKDRIDEDMRSLSEHIAEEYGLDYDTAKEHADPEFVAYGAETKIKNLRRELNLLGDINHAALTDFADVTAEYELKEATRNDLVSTEADLQRVLAMLIETMTNRFLEAFEQVNANFSEIFIKLFGGGKASLELLLSEEGATALDCGVEIHACPPGKRIDNISSLSGGERSMVALSILFAIMKLKTIPFCVLDEVEQALDETNCKLFAECLRMFCDRSQFIVITHKKATMESADELYGVTMEERGVSRLVKVTLTEAIKHAKKEEDNK